MKIVLIFAVACCFTVCHSKVASPKSADSSLIDFNLSDLIGSRKGRSESMSLLERFSVKGMLTTKAQQLIQLFVGFLNRIAKLSADNFGFTNVAMLLNNIGQAFLQYAYTIGQDYQSLSQDPNMLLQIPCSLYDSRPHCQAFTG